MIYILLFCLYNNKCSYKLRANLLNFGRSKRHEDLDGTERSYLVTLNILRSLKALRTLTPNEESGRNSDQTTSNMLPTMT